MGWDRLEARLVHPDNSKQRCMQARRAQALPTDDVACVAVLGRRQSRPAHPSTHHAHGHAAVLAAAICGLHLAAQLVHNELRVEVEW